MTKKRILGCLRVPPVEYHWPRGSGEAASGSRFEHGTSAIRRNAANHPATMFGAIFCHKSVLLLLDHVLLYTVEPCSCPINGARELRSKRFSSNLVN
jgi:hypothetical protein